jgi:hypothetical protein
LIDAGLQPEAEEDFVVGRHKAIQSAAHSLACLSRRPA